MKYGIIDVGTNSVRFMLAEYINTQIKRLHIEKSTTRLGSGLYNNENKLSDKPMADSVDAIKKFVNIAHEYNAEKILCVATSAVRDSSNADVFADMIWQNAHIKLNILSGNDEALAGFVGAMGNLVPTDTVLVDIGGGSTEIIGFDGQKITGESFKCGCVRLKELFENDFSAAQEYINQNVKVPQNKKVIWIGGTATVVAMICHNIKKYKFDSVHMSTISAKELFVLEKHVCSMSVGELQNIYNVDEKRAEILPYGLMIISHIVKNCACDSVTVSEEGLCEGLIRLDNNKNLFNIN